MPRSLGIPLAPHLASTNQALDRLPPDKWEEMLRIGLAKIEEYDPGRGTRQHLAARWMLQTTFYWEQTFAARTETVIEHRYKPSVGASVQTSLVSSRAFPHPCGGSPPTGGYQWRSTAALRGS